MNTQSQHARPDWSALGVILFVLLVLGLMAYALWIAPATGGITSQSDFGQIIG